MIFSCNASMPTIYFVNILIFLFNRFNENYFFNYFISKNNLFERFLIKSIKINVIFLTNWFITFIMYNLNFLIWLLHRRLKSIIWLTIDCRNYGFFFYAATWKFRVNSINWSEVLFQEMLFNLFFQSFIRNN